MEAPTTSTTVVTHHWQLEKYSRSRSLSDSSAPPSAPPVEWDHYTQPRLALRLEAKYTNTAHAVPNQLLLQVTYDPLYRDRTPAAASAPLLLDSIDLASFSNPQLAHATPKGQLPLKAVYRDAVLGLRYLVLRSNHPAAAEFRRVQAKFTSTAERERFVDAIRVLVPVKPAAESSAAAAAADDAPGSSKKKKKRTSTGQQQQPPPQPSVPLLATPQSQSQQNQLATTAAASRSTRRTKRARHAATVTASGSSGLSRTRLDELHHQQQEEYPPPPPPQSTSSRPPSFLNAARSSFVDSGLPYYSHQGQGQGGGFLQAQYQQQQVTTTITGARGGGAASLLGRSGSLVASLLPRLAATASNLTAAPTPTTTNPNDAEEEGERFHPHHKTASLALLALEPDALDKLLQDALLEEGFDQLVGTIKDALSGGDGGA